MSISPISPLKLYSSLLTDHNWEWGSDGKRQGFQCSFWKIPFSRIVEKWEKILSKPQHSIAFLLQPELSPARNLSVLVLNIVFLVSWDTSSRSHMINKISAEKFYQVHWKTISNRSQMFFKIGIDFGLLVSFAKFLWTSFL